MKTLIVTAHPSSKGFSHRIAQTFANHSSDAEIINLYAEDWRQGFLEFENVNKIPPEKNRKKIQKKITEADEIVFVYPIWWGLPPAILKNFCDQNFSADFAFRYIEGKPLPEGLLKGKTAVVLATADAPSLLYRFFFRTPKLFWTHKMAGILPFCGIKVRHFEIFGAMRKRSEEDRKKMLEKVKEIARKKN